MSDAETRFRNYINNHNLFNKINQIPTNGIHLLAQKIRFTECVSSLGSWIAGHGYTPHQYTLRTGYFLGYCKVILNPISGDDIIAWGDGIFFCDNGIDYEGEWRDTDYKYKKVNFEKHECDEHSPLLSHLVLLPVVLFLAFIGIAQYRNRH